MYRAETEEEAKEALKETARTPGNILSPHHGQLGDQGLCASRVSAASSANPPVPLHHEPTGAAGERGETADQGGGSVLRKEALVKLLYLVFSHLNERLEGRRLRGFAEVVMGSYHVA